MKINLSKHNKIKKELFPSNKKSKEILKIDKNNSDINIENIDKNYINDNIIKLKDILNNDGTKNIYKGLVAKSYFHDKILNKNLKITDFEIENVIGDGNCGFRALSLQIIIIRIIIIKYVVIYIIILIIIKNHIIHDI